MNRLVVIGIIGLKRCYLNVSREDAVRRYEAAEGQKAEHVQEFEFTDEFGAYDAWPK